jgi:uncharacterized protein YjbJ (UPF0337 family)
MHHDEMKGKTDQIKGKAKKAWADMTDDERLHAEGEVDEARGEANETAGRLKRKVGETIEDVGERIKR